MALGGHARQGFFLPLPHPLPIAARLFASAILALLAGPIRSRRLSPRPKTGRFRTGFTTVPRKGMRRREPLLASLQQTNPRTGVSGSLRSRQRVIMLDMDQGSANSRRSSPGSGATILTPLRGVLDRLPPARPTSVQLNHTAAIPPILPGVARHLAPVSPRSLRARSGTLIPRNWPPVSPRLTLQRRER